MSGIVKSFGKKNNKCHPFNMSISVKNNWIINGCVIAAHNKGKSTEQMVQSIEKNKSDYNLEQQKLLSNITACVRNR